MTSPTGVSDPAKLTSSKEAAPVGDTGHRKEHPVSYNLALVYALKAADHRCLCQNHEDLIRDIAEMGPLAGDLLYHIVGETMDHDCSCPPCSSWLGLSYLEHKTDALNRSAACEAPPHPIPSPAASQAAERS
jgi:hypothetical protein